MVCGGSDLGLWIEHCAVPRMVCYRCLVMSCSARKWLEGKKYLEIAVLTLAVNILAFFSVHSWQWHCWKTCVVCQWNHVLWATLKLLLFSAVLGVLSLQGSLCKQGVMVVRVPHCIQIGPRYEHVHCCQFTHPPHLWADSPLGTHHFPGSLGWLLESSSDGADACIIE